MITKKLFMAFLIFCFLSFTVIPNTAFAEAIDEEGDWDEAIGFVVIAIPLIILVAWLWAGTESSKYDTPEKPIKLAQKSKTNYHFTDEKLAVRSDADLYTYDSYKKNEPYIPDLEIGFKW